MLSDNECPLPMFWLKIKSYSNGFYSNLNKKWVANWCDSTDRYTKRDNWGDKREIICFKASISRNFSNLIKANNPENIVNVLLAC